MRALVLAGLLGCVTAKAASPPAIEDTPPPIVLDPAPSGPVVVVTTPSGPAPDTGLCSGGPYAASGALPALLAPQVIKAGLRGAEGPVWDAVTGVLYFSDLDRSGSVPWSDASSSRIMQLVPPDTVTVFKEGTGSNGLALFARLLIAATHDTHSISSFALSDGARVTGVAAASGRAFLSPNDVAVHSSGAVYLTDPTWQNDSPPADVPYGVYRVVGSAVSEVDLTLTQPNGILLSRDERVLYVGAQDADSLADGTPAWNGRGKVYRYSVDAAGATSNRQVFVDSIIWPDGMAQDCAGNVYVASSLGVQVYEQGGAALGTIEIAGGASNAAFGGNDGKTLYITSKTTLYALVINIPGLPN